MLVIDTKGYFINSIVGTIQHWRETLLVHSESQQAKSLPVPSCVPSRCAGVGVVSGSSGLGWVNINGSSTARSLHK